MLLSKRASRSLNSIDDIEAEHTRLTSNGVVFTQPPTDIGTAVVAVFDDTCGNLIQLIEEKPDENHDDAR
jgi:predicted enzyme related to lactoylglutathione lyase